MYGTSSDNTELKPFTNMAESNDASAARPAFRLRWDVFLSFRGEDTRHGFTNQLYNSLIAQGVRAFRDNEGMTQGDEIAPSLIDAIQDSAAAIAIISRSYASSRWCLEELATICDCRRLLLPVFFEVDPSDVRRQKGPFEDDFRSLESRFGKQKVARWRAAMETAGGIKGSVFKNSKELELIQLLVRRILAELSNTPMGVASYAVGLNSCVEELLRLLDVKKNGVKVLGIHGMGGVGKTTLAKAVYNKLVSQFEHRSFISNVREILMQQNGLVSLQSKLLGDLSLGRASQVDDARAGKIAIERILHEKRVLIILDDVDSESQLGAQVAKREWFYEGSRVIITTRDRDVLTAHHVNDMYEMRELGSSDSLDLFCHHACMRSGTASKTFLSLSQQIVSLTGGLPLALEVFGSFLFDKRRVEEWEDALQKLKKIRPCHLQEVLEISIKALDEEEKCIFLDIACLFVNLEMKRGEAIDIVKGCGFRAEIAINVLVARSLVKIMEDENLWMHDQIRDMGRQIVQHENLEDPGMRSRLWDRREILAVLKDRMGTRRNQGIILNFEKNHKETVAKSISLDILKTPSIASVVTYLMDIWKEYNYGAKKEGEVILQTEAFQPMVCLRLLQLSKVRLEGTFKWIPPELKWLQWRKCPLKNLPWDFCPQHLTVLDLSESRIENVWGLRWWCWHKNKVAENLMVMNLHGCYNLTAVPDLSSHQALEKLILERCTSLTTIHKSLGDATRLRHLNLRDCSNLIDFPKDVSGLKHLETLILSGCSKLKELPHDMRCLNSLRKLLADNTAIEQLPESIFRLTRLEILSLNDCKSLKRLPLCIGQLGSLRDLSLNGSALEEVPDSIGLLVDLQKLSLMWCKSLAVIPDSVHNLSMLENFWLDGSSVVELPACIGSLSYLKLLSVGNCSSLSELPVSIEGLASLVELQLGGTSIVCLPDKVDGLKSIERLEMRICKSLLSLPESVGRLLTLTTLIIVDAAIVELPESIGMLENLTMLRLNKCVKLCRLPSSIGNLNSLHHLHMEETSVTELPESFGMLSRLMILKMGKKPYREVSENAKNMKIANMSIGLPSSFPNLSVLEVFDAHAWKISGKIPDDFEKLLCLETLNLGHNDFHSLPRSLRGLSVLKKLFLPHCENLRVLPPLPSSLLELDAESCTAMESISDLSNLKNLHYLNLANCEKLKGITGLECLKSLTRLYMSGCSSCSSVAKGTLNKLALKYMRNLSVPGSEIPDWFNSEVVRYSKPKNLVIKAVIVGVVISIDHQIHDDLRDQLPVVAGIEIRILRASKPAPVFTTGPLLSGVPKNDEDHFYLCRYPDGHPLVSLLQEGDEIQVARQNPPVVEGVQLKKSGIYLVFENDDDYDGEENWLDESQQSVSQRLATFVGSSGEGSHVVDSISEVERGKERKKQGEGLLAFNHGNSFLLFFIALPAACLLLSWLMTWP